MGERGKQRQRRHRGATRAELAACWPRTVPHLRAYLHARPVPLCSTEDLLQDVFVRALEHRDQVEEPDRVEGWIHRIAAHWVTDLERRARVRERVRNDLRDACWHESSYGEQMNAFVARICVPCALRRLDAKYRRIIVATEVEGWTFSEIARREGISIPGAKSRAQRGRRMLRQLLAQCLDVDAPTDGRGFAAGPRGGGERLARCAEIRSNANFTEETV